MCFWWTPGRDAPPRARALLEDIKLITDKPVRWVVNTHFHWDHTNANSIFGPEVQIIGHEYVRHAIADLDIIHREPFKTALANMPVQVDALKKQIADEKDPAKRADLEKQLAAKQADWEEFKMLKPTPPTMTYSSKMTLFQGQRGNSAAASSDAATRRETRSSICRKRKSCAAAT